MSKFVWLILFILTAIIFYFTLSFCGAITYMIPQGVNYSCGHFTLFITNITGPIERYLTDHIFNNTSALSIFHAVINIIISLMVALVCCLIIELIIYLLKNKSKLSFK